MIKPNRWLILSLLMLGNLTLTSCMDVATSGAQIVYNHHSIQKNLTDQYKTYHAYQALNYKTRDFRNANITIATFNGDVLLAGQTPTEWQKQKAYNIVKTATNADKIYNFINIASPSSALTRMSDTWITTKVKSKLIASNDLDATQIKVITENGTVYLMGILRPAEAEAAVASASETDGVRSVVKIFSYMSISRKLTTDNPVS